MANSSRLAAFGSFIDARCAMANNGAGQAIGNATDSWQAYREGAFDDPRNRGSVSSSFDAA